MPHSLLVDALGSCIAIDLSALDRGDRAAVAAAWADAAANGEAAPVTTVKPSTGERSHMLSRLSQQVTFAAIEAARGRAWMLHAAGIATPDGQVVVLVGPSGRGKTTAARALGAAYGYVSDETIAIDIDGRVWPYRKPLSVIEDRAAPKTQVPPSALELKPLPDAPLRVSAVVLLDRDAQHPEIPVVEDVDLGDALDKLVAQTSFLHDQPAALRFIAALAAATGGIRTVKYREAATLPLVIPELVQPAAPIALPDKPAHVAPGADPEHVGPRFSRIAVADEVAVDDPDRIAILTLNESLHGHVTLLGGIAPAVWRAADGTTLQELTRAAVAAYDEPDGFDATDAVLVAVGQLLDAGLLTSDEPLLARRDDVVWVGSGEPSLSPDASQPGEQPTALTGSTALLWEWLEQPITRTQLTARAIEVAGVSGASDVAVQVGELLEQLAESRMVEQRD